MSLARAPSTAGAAGAAVAPSARGAAFWTRSRVAAALESLAAIHLPRGDEAYGRVCTDTRSVQAGDLFVALVGERFDAHHFVSEAVAKGATGVVVSRDVGRTGVPTYVVGDTLGALGALGTYRRLAWGGPLIAVVGSNGKTSTKELLRAALSSRYEVHATEGNLNNLVGAPLTLLALPDAAEIAVVELGTNHPGEIARLRAIARPNATVVTWIAEEHLEGLGDLAGVLREELAACEDVELAVVPAAQPDVCEAARSRASRVVSAGVGAGDLRADAVTLDAAGRSRLTVNGVAVDVPFAGAHNAGNAMLAIAMAKEAGIPVDAAAEGLRSGRIALPPMRAHVERHGRITLINDAYNANPASVREALGLLAAVGAGRQRIALLGTMLELGAHSERLHDAVLRAALAGPVDLVVGIGEFAAAIDRLPARDARAVTAPDPEHGWRAAASRATPDAAILIKGSRGMRLERAVPHIVAWASKA